MPDAAARRFPGTCRTNGRYEAIAVATIFGLSYGLTSPLIAADLAARGSGALLIGLNAALHAVGVLSIAPYLPRLAHRFGARVLIVAALLLSTMILVAFPAVTSIYLWFPLRLVLGIASETLFVLSETWANDLSDDTTRGRTMAVYTSAISLGYAGGPAILSAVGSGPTAFGVGAGIAALALLPMLGPWAVPPARTDSGTTRTFRYLLIAPIAIVTSFLNAAVEAAGLSFITLYATNNGWSEAQGLQMVSLLMVGAVLLQLPIGWLADCGHPRRLALTLAVLSTAGAWLWPATLTSVPLANTLAFVWGGIFVGIYTVMLTLLGQRFRGGDLIGIYALMSVAWGIGALVGPFLVGFAMTLSPQYGFPYAVAILCGLFAGFLVLGKSEA
ncbi:MAG: MFS transporter [Capsulimonadales bacterium]|nr:MFS transporter [Capsulimonadales bacterium]